MEPSDWISAGALAVAAVSIVVSGIVSPRLTARLSRSQRLRDERSLAYVDAIRLMRARSREIEDATLGPGADDEGPTSDETADITARLLLYGTRDVWDAFAKVIEHYWSASPARLQTELAQANLTDDVTARLHIHDIHTLMATEQNAAIDAMRIDVGAAPFHVKRASRDAAGRARRRASRSSRRRPTRSA